VTTTNVDNPRQQLAELEQRVLDGDESVTAAALAKARDAAQLADLHDAAARRQADRDTAALRQATEDALRAEIRSHADRLPSLRRAYATTVDALRDLSDQITDWQETRRTLEQQAKPLGLAADVDVALPDLNGRDWVAVAHDEAVGRYQRGPATRLHDGGLRTAPVRFHILHDAKTRERITRDDEARAEARAERHRERELERSRNVGGYGS
jgi:hypothetical protein